MQTDLIEEIQGIIKEAYSNVSQSQPEPNTEPPEPPEQDSTEDLLHLEQNFLLLFTTAVWFLEHDPYMSVAMNLNVNC